MGFFGDLFKKIGGFFSRKPKEAPKAPTPAKPVQAPAWHIVSQTTRHTGGAGQDYNTSFTYGAEGVFENKPSLDKLEKMLKNSLIAAFNSGTKKRGRMPPKVYNSLVDSSIRGIEIRQTTLVPNNKLKAKIEINDGATTWKGEN